MLVSICIPSYNSAPTLKTCLESIVSQTFEDYEVVICDDSSNAEVAEMVNAFDLKNKLRYVKNDVALGSPGNWNKTLALAKGKYVKIMHHDDYFTNPGSLQKFVRALEDSPSANFVCSYSRIYFKQTKDFYSHKQTSSQIVRLRKEPEYLFFRNVVGAPSATFFRKHENCLFTEGYRWLVDVEFYIRFLRAFPGIVFIPEALVTVVDGEDGQTTREVSNDANVVIGEHLKLFSSIFSENLARPKSRLYFEELFLRFDISNMKALEQKYTVPANLTNFLKQVFAELPKNRLLKKLKKRLLTSRYNRSIFKIERF